MAVLVSSLPAAAADLLVERAVYDAGARIQCSATVVDLEGDGTLDIVVTTQGGEVIALASDGAPKWVAAGMPQMTVPAAAADLLPQPGLELVVADRTGRVRCLSAAGQVLWELRVGQEIDWSAPAILGLPGAELRPRGGAPLIVVGDEVTGLCAISPQGKLVWTYRVPGISGVACPPAVGDVDGDGAQEIIFGAGDGLIRCLSREGKDKWSFKTGGDAFTGPVIANLDGDGRVEVVTASGDGFVYALDGGSGKVVWKFESGAPVDSAIAVADVLAQAGLEVLFANNAGRFCCLSARGELVWSRQLGRTTTPPCIADLDADGALELTIGDHSGILYVFSPAGQLLEKHEFAGRVNAAPTVLPLPQGLGLVVPDETGKVHIFAAPRSTTGAPVAWSGFRGDPAGRGDARIAASEARGPVRILAADPGALLMGPNVFRATVRNDSGADALVTLEVAAPQGRTFVMQRRQQPGQVGARHALPVQYELEYEIAARGEHRFVVSAVPLSAGAAPARSERSVEVTPFARDEAQLARLLQTARETAEHLAALGCGAQYITTTADFLRREAGQLDVPEFDALEQSRRRELARAFPSVLERARKLAAKGLFATSALEQGRRDFAVWQAQPYAGFDPDVVPLEPAATANVTLCRREKDPVALNIFNFRDEPLPLRVLHGDLKAQGSDTVVPAAQAMTLRRVVFAPSTDGKLYPDALPRLDAIDSLTVAPWQAAQLWITIDATDLESGAYQAALTLAPVPPGVESLTVPLTITVRSLALEGPSPLASCQWAYLDAATTADKMQEAADDLLAHDTNVFVFTNPWTPMPKTDAEGNLLQPLDFTRHDELFEMYHRPKGHLLYFTGSPRLSGAVELWSPAWEKACAAWLKGMAQHLQSLGLDYQDWAWYPIDEAGKELIPDLLRAAKFAKQVDPRIQVYYDFFQGPVEVGLDDLKRLDPYIDIWQPHRGIVGSERPEDTERMDFLRSTGEPVWTYDTSGGSHSLSPSGYYRSQGWLAWDRGITGVGFWTYNSTATDQWQEGNDREYLALYQGREIIPSKRWEAWRDGIEDYWYLTLLRDAADRARSAGRQDVAAQADRVIASAVAAVMADKDNPEVYERQRRIIGDLAERIAKELGGGA